MRHHVAAAAAVQQLFGPVRWLRSVPDPLPVQHTGPVQIDVRRPVSDVHGTAAPTAGWRRRPGRQRVVRVHPIDTVRLADDRAVDLQSAVPVEERAARLLQLRGALARRRRLHGTEHRRDHAEEVVPFGLLADDGGPGQMMQCVGACAASATRDYTRTVPVLVVLLF